MKKILLSVVCLMLVLASVSAAGKNDQGAAPQGTPEITYWMPLNPNFAQVVQEFGQTEYAKQLEKNTNTKINWQHIAAGNDSQITEGFNILVASGNYPDIIEYRWIRYPGGPSAAITDKVILPLNDIFEKYCPNITKMLKENPDIAKMISTDDGTYYVFPFLRGTSADNNMLLFSEGWVLRKDYLDKVGLDVPATPAEWYRVLKAFKDQLGVQIPLTLRKDHVSRALAPGFDSFDDFYVENGKVYHGLIQNERRAYLAEIRKWYAEGLLDNDYFAVDRNTQQTKVLNSIVGATWAPGGSGIGTWLPAMQKNDPSVRMVSAAPMTPVRGRNSKFARMNTIYSDSGYSAAISTSCKNIEAAARLLDYSYGQEGHMLANFGIEGLTYNMVNGYPTYTDLILKNPDGRSITQAMSLYIRGHVHGPFVQDQRELEQYYTLPELKDALKLWTKTDMGKYMMPAVSAPEDESNELARIMNNVNTYKDEMEAKFITGAISMSEFENYVAQLKKFGIERAIEIKQAGYDRYMKK
ncbi:extracellular solute-binding protein [Treponema sp. OttesenSCG-928-L16]|nr:extracellular solute-binding protein [Treponema sp. OttesenSCG-928-L16]